MLIKYKKIHFLIEIGATVEWRHRFLKSLARVVFLLMWEGMLCCCTYRIQKYRQRFSFPPHRKHTPGVFFKKPRNFSWKFFLLSFFRCCCFKCHCRFVYYKEASEYVFNWCYSFQRPSAGIFHLKKKRTNRTSSAHLVFLKLVSDRMPIINFETPECRAVPTKLSF